MKKINNYITNSIISLAAAACCVLSTLLILSCEMPTDGKFSGNVRGLSAPLTVPENVRAVEGQDGGTIIITWDAVPDVDGYNVYRSKGASAQVSLRGGASGASYRDSGKSVAPATPYYYFVSAYKGSAESEKASSGVVELSSGAPGILAAPEITGATVSGSGITLTWTGVPGAAEYRIYRSSSYDDKQYIFRHKDPATSYLDTNLTPGEYTYQVSAVSPEGGEGYLSLSSDWVEIAAAGERLPVPPAPANITARIGDGPSIIVTWQASVDATLYRVMRSEDGETYTEIGYVEGKTSYINGSSDSQPCQPGASYYYRIKPYNGSQEGYLSQACGPIMIPPAKPVITSASGTPYNVSVTWTLEGKADGFRLYRSTDNSQYELLKAVPGNEYSYTDISAGAGTFYYRMRAYNFAGEGAQSEAKQTVIRQAPPPFVAVSGISGVPNTVQAGVPLTLTGTVQPAGATSKTIGWTVKSAGGTGAAINGATFTATAAGTAVVTATIENGLGSGSAYAQDFTITVSASFVAVSGISGVPGTAQAGVPLTLTGTVQPAGATNKTIGWTVKSAGGTGAAISGAAFTATAAGTAVVTATIENGLSPGSVYAQDFTITVTVSEFEAADSAAFSAALSSARESGGDHFTITVSSNMSLGPQDLTSLDYADKTIVLKGDTPARTISLESAGSLFTVGQDVTLELEDIVLQGITTNTAPLVTVNTDGKLAVKTGGKITGNTYVTAAAQTGGGGVLVSGGELEIAGGEISGNTVNGSGSHTLGGGILADNSRIVMNGGTISGNNIISRHPGDGGGMGGGISIRNNSYFEMVDGKIEGNTIDTESTTMGNGATGGGVYSGDSTFRLSGGLIRNNRATSRAANIYCGSGGGGVGINSNTGTITSIFVMEGGTISGNTVSASTNPNSTYLNGQYTIGAYGGGVVLHMGSPSCSAAMTKTGGIIYGNGVTGNDADGFPLKNMAQSNGSGLGGGHAVCFNVDGSSTQYLRNSTSNAADNMDSSKSGTAGGWE
jgi:fibronectin type 3 domain-containing protein